jgi:hypothetical protein
MSTTVWLSLFTLAVTSAVALIIAAMHRKQMRQIELHRADPAVPLVPPNAFTKFLRGNFRHINLAVNAALNIVFLTEHVRSATPLTKVEVLAIAFFMNSLFLSLVLYVLSWNTQMVFNAIYACRDVIDMLSNQIGKIIGISESQTRVVGKLTERVFEEDKPPKKMR